MTNYESTRAKIFEVYTTHVAPSSAEHDPGPYLPPGNWTPDEMELLIRGHILFKQLNENQIKSNSRRKMSTDIYYMLREKFALMRSGTTDTNKEAAK